MSPRPGVHPTAVLDGDIELADGATVGPHAVLTGRISVGPNTRVLAHTIIEGHTVVGANCQLGPGAAVGTAPQARAFDGGETCLVVGDNVIAREFSTLHRSLKPGLENATRVGNGCMIMACAHVAHDCRVGENVVLANAVLLGGHVTVGDHAFLGGAAVVHQFCRIGRLAMVGGGEIVVKDVLPLSVYRQGGHRAYNAIGCRRSGLTATQLRAVRQAFKDLYAHRSFVQATAALRAGRGEGLSAELRELIEFIETSPRGVEAAVRGAKREEAEE